MMNTMIKKSPNQVSSIPRRNDEIRDEEIDNDDGIIYPPGYSVASPIPMNDPNSLPLAPAVLIEEHNTHSAEEGRLPTQNSEESHSKKTDSRFNPFRPVHPQCDHISYGCLTMVFLVFVGMAVLLKTYLPDILLTRYEEKKLVASDGSSNDFLGASCSMSGDLVVVGAEGVDDNEGAAYLFHLDGTEIKKLTPGDDGEENDWFGTSVAIDEKVVVGSWGDYVDVFSRQGIYERSISCDDCNFGRDVATLGNLIVMNGFQNSIYKLFVFSTESELSKTFDQGSDEIYDVAMSEKFIVSTALDGKTFIYSNASPDFPRIAEINQGGLEVAVAGDRIVIGNGWANDDDGGAWLYKTDGTLVKTLDRQDASSGSWFGSSVAITDDKVIVGADEDDDQGYDSGSIFIYSAVTGEFVEKVLAPDGEAEDSFGSSVCASDSHYLVGAMGVDSFTGAAYLFQSSEE